MNDQTRSRWTLGISSGVAFAIIMAGAQTMLSVGKASQRLDQVEAAQEHAVTRAEYNAHQQAMLRELERLNRNVERLIESRQ